MPRVHSDLTIGKLIGSGFFGRVFAAKDKVHGTVAVKVFRQRPDEKLVKWEQRKENLLREGQKLKKAQHRNVVQVLHLTEEEDGEAVYLTMEYCGGGSLQSRYEKGPMTLLEVRNVTSDVLGGLEALHAREMLHRDIKPGNLLLDNGGVGKLGDFGLVTDEIVLGYASQSGYSDHLPPEVWNGGGTSVRSDIFALGMTMYRLLHGQQWHEEGDIPRDAIPLGGYAARLKWLPHIPKPWRTFLRRMLHDDPGSRFQSANQVWSALAKLPVEPDWSVEVGADEIVWTRQKAGRRHVVRRQRHTPRSSSWAAVSEPLDHGIRRTLGGSIGRMPGRECDRQLGEFFASAR